MALARLLRFTIYRPPTFSSPFSFLFVQSVRQESLHSLLLPSHRAYGIERRAHTLDRKGERKGGKRASSKRDKATLLSKKEKKRKRTTRGKIKFFSFFQIGSSGFHSTWNGTRAFTTPRNRHERHNLHLNFRSVEAANPDGRNGGNRGILRGVGSVATKSLIIHP